MSELTLPQAKKMIWVLFILLVITIGMIFYETNDFLGFQLYEEIYERSLCHELTLRDIPFKQQLRIPLIYKGKTVGNELRLDLFVDDRVIVENKAVRCITDLHQAQLLSYMRLANCRVGLIINYNEALLIEGIKRMVL